MRRTVVLLTSMALAVLLASGVALAASQLDQQQTSTNSGIGFDKQYKMAQTFTAGLSGSLDKVSVHIQRMGSTDVGDLQVSIQTLDSSGFPSTKVLGSGSVPASNFVTNDPADWKDVRLTQPAPVSSGTKYALVLSTANAPADGSLYNWSAGTNDPYAGGDALSWNWLQPGQWSVRPIDRKPADFAFKTFVAHTTAPPPQAPRVQAVTPVNGATDVAPRSNVVATFSEAMKAGSLKNAFTLAKRHAHGTTTRVAAKVRYDAVAKRAVLDPHANLVRGAKYVATVTTSAKDLAGNSLDQNRTAAGNQPKKWTFTVRP
jgi:hypothetical protein